MQRARAKKASRLGVLINILATGNPDSEGRVAGSRAKLLAWKSAGEWRESIAIELPVGGRYNIDSRSDAERASECC